MLMRIYKNHFALADHVIPPAQHPFLGWSRHRSLRCPCTQLPQYVGGNFFPGQTEKFCLGRVNFYGEHCLLLGYPVVVCTRRFLYLYNNDADFNMPMCVYFERKGLWENQSPSPTWWLSFDSGLARLDSLDWGSTQTKLALTPCT